MALGDKGTAVSKGVRLTVTVSLIIQKPNFFFPGFPSAIAYIAAHLQESFLFLRIIENHIGEPLLRCILKTWKLNSLLPGIYESTRENKLRQLSFTLLNRTTNTRNNYFEFD